MGQRIREHDSFFSRKHRYALGLDLESNRHYASLPVTIGVADYNEYYLLTDSQYEHYLADPEGALAFIEECRRREHDDLLMQQPGWNRGTPM